MRALVVYCHPDPNSFNAAIRDLVLARLRAGGAEVRVNDLYARGFDPRLTSAELAGYQDCPANQTAVSEDVANIRWCDTLIFVYPTWWYGLPAMLKGWIDRVMLPEVAFLLPDRVNGVIRPGLTHIARMAVFTTCGASWWLSRIVGQPGKRTLLRGVGYLLRQRRKVTFAAHYLMDSSTPESRARHLARVGTRMDRLIKSAPVPG